MTLNLRPDFFIVGAPKCGTTALNAYLSLHPAIFMARKEQHFFGSDLEMAWHRPDQEEYLASFAGGQAAVQCGEASVWYLMSRAAAREIHMFNPEARIIVMLRNPVEMLPSLHSQALLSHSENIEDFSEALAAEADRRAGKRFPPHCTFPASLLYRQTARFKEQLERYFAVFPRDQIHVVVFDDLVADTPRTYRAVLQFLGVDPDFVPQFRVVNANKRPRSKWIHQRLWDLWDPQSTTRRVGRRLVPIRHLRNGVWHVATRLNTAVAPREPIDPQAQQSLAAAFAPEIRELGELLGRDLTHWCSSEGSRGALASTEPPGPDLSGGPTVSHRWAP